MLVAGKDDIDIVFDQRLLDRPSQHGSRKRVAAGAVQRVMHEDDLPVGVRP